MTLPCRVLRFVSHASWNALGAPRYAYAIRAGYTDNRIYVSPRARATWAAFDARSRSKSRSLLPRRESLIRKINDADLSHVAQSSATDRRGVRAVTKCV
ncbi:hypothetical protein PUN28_015374 [Cardiocondyla obscurior]|uniref:Uncharacterized protein n=1 Tax=Cardiocondyla obscurior TaxID=286306 RepID=A0AAW2EUE1_9HYME